MLDVDVCVSCVRVRIKVWHARILSHLMPV